MDGTSVGATSGHDLAGRFTSGNSERAARKVRIAERLTALCEDYEPTPSQRQLLAIVATHLDDAERARSLVSRIRAANSARRLLKDIPRKPPPPRPSLSEQLRQMEKSRD